jgi:hypothetical protein
MRRVQQLMLTSKFLSLLGAVPIIMDGIETRATSWSIGEFTDTKKIEGASHSTTVEGL